MVDGSILCDGTIVDEIVEEFGTTLVIKEVAKSFDTEYGDATETYTDYSKKVLIQSWSADSQEVREGMFQAGTLTVTFMNTDLFLAKLGNKVIYLGDTYAIDRITKQPLVDVNYYVYCILKKA